MKLVITGSTAWTSAGQGAGALLELLESGRDAFTEPPPYPAQGLASPACAQIHELDRERPAEVLLEHVVRQALAQAGRPSGRIGLVAGTSSGNICGPWERWHRARLQGEQASEEGTWRQDPTRVVAERLGLARHTTVSVACASGTAGLAVAQGWLADDLCDAVVVAGVDALSLYVHAGFNGLGALSAGRPHPFSASRDGLLLGEGAGACVVEPAPSAWARDAHVLAELHGTGLSADGVHMTAPDREGKGAARAMQAALDEAGVSPEQVDMVSCHATGTRFNDGMEAHALASVLGTRSVGFFGVKQIIGHTLGAAGSIETAALIEAIEQGRQPPCPTDLDAELPLTPAPRFPRAPTVVLSTNSAFGGANAAAVFCKPGALPEPTPRSPRAVRVLGSATLSAEPGEKLGERWPDAPERFRRLNRYVRAGLLVLRELFEQTGAPTERTGVVLASASNCRATDLRYHQKLVQRGADRAPRVEFIYTIPGAPAGEAAILWTLRGPTLTICGEEHEARDEAERLIRWGRAEQLVALWIEAPESQGRVRASALLLSS
jgi:3-oxoacyl-[acyl-carrier-protein] synthase II